MPQRTNSFQDLISQIESQLALAGAKLTRSALLGTPSREIDLLIEHSIGGHPIKVATECRSTGRRSTIEWIDALVGKYRSLAVDKVVAVSKKGFTHAAIKRASELGIQTLAFSNVDEIEWAIFLSGPKRSTITMLDKKVPHLFLGCDDAYILVSDYLDRAYYLRGVRQVAIRGLIDAVLAYPDFMREMYFRACKGKNAVVAYMFDDGNMIEGNDHKEHPVAILILNV